MIFEQALRHVGYVWYWILVAKTQGGEVIAAVMSVNYGAGMRELNRAITEVEHV